MYPSLKGIKIAVLGGDAREVILVVSALLNLGTEIRLIGMPAQKNPSITMCRTITDEF